jgi:hypothetical protein
MTAPGWGRDQLRINRVLAARCRRAMLSPAEGLMKLEAAAGAEWSVSKAAQKKFFEFRGNLREVPASPPDRV